MEEIILAEEYPTPEEYVELRKMVGWSIPDRTAIAPSLRNSHCGICARAQGKIVGMARIIGDGGMVYYIQDVIVDPSRQGQGIGKRLMDRVMEYIRRHAVEHTIVGLMAASGKEEFYERYGFTRRPSDKFGAGMTIFWDASKSVEPAPGGGPG
jgi:ribosomal protein S18 acetylase RimI-like enzyme